MKLGPALLFVVMLAACSSSNDMNPGAPRSKATVYTGGGAGMANVPVVVTNPDGSRVTTGNTVYVPAK